MIRLFKVAMSSQAKFDVADVLDSGYIGQGPKVEAFERALETTFFPQKPARLLTLNSATSALDLALELVGVGPGDAVVTTPMTCTATNSPIVKRGAIPVWADVNGRGLVTPGSVKAAAESVKGYRTVKAIMVVDWAGALPDYRGIRKAVPGIPIIEDAAHRLPGETNGGDYVVWSFQAIKFLTTGDGGALLTPFNQYDRAKLLRWYGLDRESSASFRCEQMITEVGFKYHMNDIAASIGLANLKQAEQNLRIQRDNARFLSKRLGIDFDESSHYWFFPMTVQNRDKFVAHMAERGIETSQVHARNDKHPGFHYPRKLSGVDWYDAHQIAIPCGWWLTQLELDAVAEAVLSYQP